LAQSIVLRLSFAVHRTGQNNPNALDLVVTGGGDRRRVSELEGFMTNITMKRAGAAVLGAAALVAVGLAGASPASAAEAPKGVTTHPAPTVPGGVLTDHMQSWETTYYNGVSWRANVRVDYGRTGSWTVCSDGTEIHGPLQGPGYWIFKGSCSGHGTITTYGWYDG
jgi:hypothetical protein